MCSKWLQLKLRVENMADFLQGHYAIVIGHSSESIFNGRIVAHLLSCQS